MKLEKRDRSLQGIPRKGDLHPRQVAQCKNPQASWTRPQGRSFRAAGLARGELD